LSEQKSAEQRGKSPNFAFLAEYEPLLTQYAGQAETYVFSDPNTALIKLRQFSELLASQISARIGTYSGESDFLPLLRDLEERRILTREVASLFHTIRK